MGRIARKLRQWSAEWFDLPQHIVMDLPRFTMIGNRQLIVENHRGVLHFTSDHMRLALANGELEVFGTNLSIRGIWTEEVCIEGAIHDIKYHGTGESS
ncbi:sporulation protein YqfC [Paenibacillus sp. 481]|uniref:sporulation protein YqfC n=1 Tax=Paenibacillus sp. 481 TaxID=2835869 RepID=UPI001E2BFB5E|nr:sporulation protein YqfC [Paenibacillus sp. 481]UHA74171.1 sporulation protein YqfC [Paenibacillus sp. 481]